MTCICCTVSISVNHFFLDKLPETWRVYVLSSHTEFERCFGRTADKKRKLYNGMLKCDLFMYGKRV